MRKVYLEPNTDDEWGCVMDIEEGSPVQCWRVASQDLYSDQKKCHRGCAALGLQVMGAQSAATMHLCCLAMPSHGIFAELVDAPPEEG